MARFRTRSAPYDLMLKQNRINTTRLVSKTSEYFSWFDEDVSGIKRYTMRLAKKRIKINGNGHKGKFNG